MCLLTLPFMSPLVIALTVVIGVAGVACVILAAKVITKTSAWHDVVRDLGLALLIAAIVSTLYELNSRTVFDLDRLEGVLKTVLASNVPPSVWDQVNREILQRQVIRKNVDFRVTLTSDVNLPEPQKVLKITFAYDLYSLGPTKIKYTLTNELGSVGSPQKKLPRFESATIGNTVYQGESLIKLINDRTLTIKDIEIRPTDPVHIEVVRSEIIYTPGNYDIAMSELTDSIRVHIDSGGILRGDVKIWSDKASATLSPAGDMWFFNGVMFPGQRISIRFT
jgi:hypothetical protein